MENTSENLYYNDDTTTLPKNAKDLTALVLKVQENSEKIKYEKDQSTKTSRTTDLRIDNEGIELIVSF